MDEVEFNAPSKCTNISFSGSHHNILDFSTPNGPSDHESNNQTPDRPRHYLIDFTNPVDFPFIDQSRLDPPPISSCPSAVKNSGSPEVVQDYYDACLGYIQDMLMEEEDDLDGHSSSALPVDQRDLEATERSFYDALGLQEDCNSTYSDKYPLLRDCPGSTDDLLPSGSDPNESVSSLGCEDISCIQNVEESSWSNHQTDIDGGSVLYTDVVGESHGSHSHSSDSFDGLHRPLNVSQDHPLPISSQCKFVDTMESNFYPVVQTEGRRIHQRDDKCGQEIGRTNKHLASYSEPFVEMERYDEVLLDKEDVKALYSVSNSRQLESSYRDKSSGSRNSRRPRCRRNCHKKKRKGGDVVDLMTLLTSCAQSVASFDLQTATKQLKELRENSSAHGSSIQRVAHYFVHALEARIAASDEHKFSDLVNSQVPASGVLKAFECYVTAIPVTRISFFLANRTIVKLAKNAESIHVIDFGILYGFQWPSLIQQLSERSMGPPRLKITGIDHPERGFRPAKKLEEAGRCLEVYCKRFKVPFQYHALAKKWETIQREDINLEEGELVVVNCQYRSVTLLDESIEVDCPRDAFLRFIRSLNPNIFFHGIANSTCSSPFFITRFREALFYFNSIFDMFDATVDHESYERRLIEQTFHGERIMNVVAREGVERVWRPETYKQWQFRTLRAGFTGITMDRELVDRAKAIVKTGYHKDFVVDEDGYWLLQGWKGRILFAMSCWIPA